MKSMNVFTVVLVFTSYLLSNIAGQELLENAKDIGYSRRRRQAINVDKLHVQVEETFNDIKRKNDLMHDVYIKTFEDIIAKMDERDSRNADSVSKLEEMKMKMTAMDRHMRAMDGKLENIYSVSNGGASKVDDMSETMKFLAGKMHNLTLTDNNAEGRNPNNEVIRKIENLATKEDILAIQMGTSNNLKYTTGKFDNLTAKLEELEGKTDEATKMEAAPCGTSIVAAQGSIKFDCVQYRRESRKCIWTVRANKKSKVVFNLKGTSSQTIKSLITLYPYRLLAAINRTRLTSDTTKIMFPDETNHEVMGPLVFVTFDYNSEDRNVDFSKFTLNFSGEEEDEIQTLKYSHYHYWQFSKRVSYPFSGDSYQPNEIATFVVNPVTCSSFELILSKINIEKSSWCKHDSLTITMEVVNATTPYYAKFGRYSNDHRWCGLYGNESTGIYSVSSYILTFKSDGNSEFGGFEFFWKV